MFDWLKGAAMRKFAKMQREELVQFIEMLEGADDQEVGLVVALATNFRHEFSQRCDLLRPMVNAEVQIPLELVRIYQQYQKIV